MKYLTQPRLQLIAAVTAMIAGGVAGYMIDGRIVWLTTISTAVGVIFGGGFVRSALENTFTHKIES